MLVGSAPSDFSGQGRLQNFGQMMPRECGVVFKPIHVIACNKRKVFVQGSEATRQSILFAAKEKTGLLRFARNDGEVGVRIRPFILRCERSEPRRIGGPAGGRSSFEARKSAHLRMTFYRTNSISRDDLAFTGVNVRRVER